MHTQVEIWSDVVCPWCYLGKRRFEHRLLQLAGARQHQSDLLERLYRAHFTEQVSIFDHETLAGLAADAGLDPDEAAKVLAGEEYGPAVDADEAMASQLGVTGVPFFVFHRRYGISGAQPAAAIVQVLDRAWADASPA